MNITKILVGIVGLMLLFGATPAPADVTELSFAFDVTHGAQHDDASWLSANYTAQGATFNADATGPVDTANVLLYAGANDVGNIKADIKTWFEGDGAKLLWLAGDSDFSGFYIAAGTNDVLAELGSQLRMDAGSIEDPVNNDDAAYRVAPNAPVTGGTFNTIFNTGVSSVIMHGPTSVLGFDGTNVVDLRTGTLTGVEVVMQASSDAVSLDGDFTVGTFDYYSQEDPSGGSYPMMAVEDMGNHKYVIISGESIFTNYKNMYGLKTEQSAFDNPDAWNSGNHDGKTLVDNVFEWFADEVHAAEEEAAADTDDDGLPFPAFAFAAAFLALIPILKRRKN